MKILLTTSTISAVVVLSLLGTRSTIAAATILLRERVTPTSTVVRLGDVAEITSADRSQARRLAALPLMPAPLPGSERYLRKQEVVDLLAAHGQDLRELRVEGAGQVAIVSPAAAGDRGKSPAQVAAAPKSMNLHAAILADRNGRAVTAPTAGSGTADDVRLALNRVIESYVETKTGRPGTWQVNCDVAGPQLAQLGASASRLTCQGGREPWTGRQRFVISFSTSQGPAQFPVSADVVDMAARVAVAIQPIARGAVITAADVELQGLASVPATTARRASVDSLEKLVGLEARQAIQPGDIIYTDELQSPVLVKRGEVITIVSQGGGIRVRTTARARQDGAKDELVQVESIETRERYEARVTGPREASVFLAARVIETSTNSRRDRWATVPRPPRPAQVAIPNSKTLETARRVP